MATSNVERSDFPKDFIFGAGTSAYQVEGAWNKDGKGRSIWDNFAIHTPASIADGSNGCIAIDHYTMFKDDVALMKKVGLDAYRFSIAWSRILPEGKLCGGVSKEGIKYYNGLIDALLAQGIQPWAVLFHWDLPQCLEEEYNGWLDKQIVQDFCDFADVCFWEFGDRVQNWTTLNEPWSFTYMGYVSARFAPGRGGLIRHLINQAQEDAKENAKQEQAGNKKEVDAKSRKPDSSEENANQEQAGNKKEVDAKSRKPDSSEGSSDSNSSEGSSDSDSSEHSSDSDSSDSDSDDDLDWLSCFIKVIDDVSKGPDKCSTNLPMLNQELTHRCPPIGTDDEDTDSDSADSDSDEEDSDSDEEDSDSDDDDNMIRNMVAYAVLERAIQTSSTDEFKKIIGLGQPKDKPDTDAAAAAAAAAQKKSVVKKALKGDPGTEPYKVAHHLILAHAHAVHLYRTRYQKNQGGQIGMTNLGIWYYPLNETQEDDDAASRVIDFRLGWFLSPIVHGDYPASMRNIVRKRLPKFTPEEVKLVKGSYDFLGINYYTTHYATHAPQNNEYKKPHHDTDVGFDNKVERGKDPISDEKGGSSWLYTVPDGIYQLMLYIKERYNDPVIYITENGIDDTPSKTNTISTLRKDEWRIKYHESHLASLKKAMLENQVQVKGYFIWSFIDNFEWANGYNSRFGIFYVDFMNGRLTRFPKDSAKWWMNFIDKRRKTEKTQEEQAASSKK